jgi:hypothetical protein
MGRNIQRVADECRMGSRRVWNYVWMKTRFKQQDACMLCMNECEVSSLRIEKEVVGGEG